MQLLKRDPHVLVQLPNYVRRRYRTLRKNALHSLSLVPYALRLNIDAALRRVPRRAA
jgi:hypothetical protein